MDSVVWVEWLRGGGWKMNTDLEGVQRFDRGEKRQLMQQRRKETSFVQLKEKCNLDETPI